MTAPASAVRLPAANPRLCAVAVCDRPPVWQVGPDARACDGCLAYVLADYYAHDYDGFSPCVVLPISLGALR